MTTDDRDPAVQAEIDRAVRELTRRLRPWVTGMADVDGFAREFVEALHREGWWPHLKAEPLKPRGPASPPNADWHTAKAKIRGET